ncbi:ribonucleotide reductase N-terminal alpha domain-containing protein [Deinococcus sp. NW-56]|uniref:TSCPD domain-containing protein n=1 Tax=Deinococcus sp. NW-56 TaxID=2080419 RepID=UPI0018F86F5E|nr:ribonucleotide reductase N-terminal alpha domain-containing protein [Deinococcus sp. NW-56]
MTTTPDPALRHFDDNAQHIAKRQYLQPGDGDIAGMFRRIATWVAGAEAGEVREHWAQRYYDLMAEKKFCPGGRVLAGAGTQHGNVLNCLQADTLVETREGQRRIADLSGPAEVLSQGGVYRTAVFRSYGRQELYRVLFENGETVEATAGHEWPVGKRSQSGRYRKVTTLDLPGQWVPVLPTGRRPVRDDDFEAGVRHGVTYGDGSKNTNGHTHHVQLFGAKRQLAQHFGEFRVHDAVYAGREVTVAQGMRGDLKALPDELSSDAYWYGFFCGLLATDGGVDDRGSAAIYQSDADELARLSRQLVRFGVKAASLRLFRHADGGYGGKPSYALRLLKQTLRPEDFLREDQRERFERSSLGQAAPRNASLRVVGIEPTGRTEEVFCCEEPQTRTFVIQGGLLTGNCFVQGATEHAPESFDGVMEVARKLALVTKVGGGNGVNLDVYAPRSAQSRPDAGVRGWVYMAATHPDVTDFVEGLMRPPTQPDGDKAPVAVRNWTRVVYGEAVPTDLVALARQNGVQIVRALPEGVQAVADDMGGIIDAARAVAETARVGVEPRIDLSPMRPEGAPIRGSGGTSSGPVSFLLEIFDNFLEWANRGGETSGPVNTLRFVYSPVLRVVRQGGTRRGAGMATIAIEHPDVLDFLTAKDLDREAAEGDISTFNISILITEKFWQALERDALWHVDVQEVPGKYYLAPQDGLYDGRLPALPDRAEDGARGVPLYRTAPQGRYNPADKRPGVPAKWLWDQIAEHAWSTGEPGLIFVDRVNEHSALKNLGKRYEIRSTNPCVTGDTLVAVADGRGAISFRELTEAGLDVPVYAKDDRGNVAVRWMRNPRVTGYAQPIYEVAFDDGLKVRVTGNHKFNLTDGTFREALELQPGDSVASMTRFHAKFDEVLPHMTKTRSQDYVWLTSGKGQPRGEHRLIAAFSLGRALKTGEVVHHRDYDAQNNRPSNLEVMTVEAHDDLHRADMLGDNNPMRERWWGQLTDAEKDAYRSRMSASTSGERNGRHSGLSHAELEEAARELAHTLGRGFTNREWQTHARERGLPQSFSEHRETELGSVNALSERIATELGLPPLPRGVGQSRQAVHNFDLYQSALASGYVAVRHEGNFYPIVTRACEDCGTHYEQPWSRREVSYCRPCGLKRASAAGREGARAATRRISEHTSERQVRAFNDLKFRLGRRPLKAEWEAHCREAGVPVRLHPGGLPTYAALTERASMANHRVVSVEYVGVEDVYNGTVDEFHNYYIGHHSMSADGEKPRFSYVNTRQCGEIPLTIGEPCDLGAINLAAYVKGSAFDYPTFRADVRTCVRFLDDVLDVNVFALEDNRVASQDLRRLGLGVMGLADALIKLGLRYDSEAGRQAIHDIMTALREEAVAESERLGKERGHYPVYTRSPRKIPHAARRNVAVLTVAPTGTTSMLMGVSSGIEPVFSPFIWRKIGSEYRALLHPLFMELLNQYPPASNMEADGGGWNWDRVTEAVSENHGSVVGLAFIPEALQQVFVCAHDISPVDHVRMQGTVQRAFDEGGQHAANSLSKTINLPNSATVADVQTAYAEAYKTGCKGITVYRDGSRQFQVLSTSKKKEKKVEETVTAEAVAEVMGESPQPAPVAAQPEAASVSAAPAAAALTPRPAAAAPAPVYERPTRLSGITDMVKLTDPTSGHRRSFLVTVNHLNGKPVEVMVISGRAGDEANADSEALGRVVSIALQHGVPAQAIIKTLRGINGGLYGSYNGRLVGSKADLIAVALDTFAKDMDAASLPPLAGGSVDAPAAAPAAPSGVSVEGMGRERCPVCEEKAVIREEGCLKCQACGYSKCG